MLSSETSYYAPSGPTPMRYWRIIATAASHTTDNGSGFFGANQISFYESVDGSGTDLCLTKTASASSFLNSTYAPAKANDNDVNTRWASEVSVDYTTTAQWWAIDFGAGNEKVVHSIQLRPYAGVSYHPPTVNLQYSSNGSTWTTFVSLALPNQGTLITVGDVAWSAAYIDNGSATNNNYLSGGDYTAIIGYTVLQSFHLHGLSYYQYEAYEAIVTPVLFTTLAGQTPIMGIAKTFTDIGWKDLFFTQPLVITSGDTIYIGFWCNSGHSGAWSYNTGAASNITDWLTMVSGFRYAAGGPYTGGSWSAGHAATSSMQMKLIY